VTTFARTTQIVGRNVKCVTIGSVCKAAAAAAVIGMISIYSVDQLSRAQAVVAANPTAPSELRDLLCRIEGAVLPPTTFPECGPPKSSHASLGTLHFAALTGETPCPSKS